jgi:Family of unknown function (DUF6174)
MTDRRSFDPSANDVRASSTGPGSKSTPGWARALVGAAILLGLVLGAGLALELFVVERLPQLTVEAVEAAETRWNQQGPQSYDLDLTIEGAQPGVVHVEVRDGVTTAMQRDGVAPKQRRVWDVWSVPGMFTTIEQELQNAEDPHNGMGLASGASIDLRAEFDPTYGYPARFHRIVFGGGPEVNWKVTKFQPM